MQKPLISPALYPARHHGAYIKHQIALVYFDIMDVFGQRHLPEYYGQSQFLALMDWPAYAPPIQQPLAACHSMNQTQADCAKKRLPLFVGQVLPHLRLLTNKRQPP